MGLLSYKKLLELSMKPRGNDYICMFILKYNDHVHN